jgi:catalase
MIINNNGGKNSNFRQGFSQQRADRIPAANKSPGLNFSPLASELTFPAKSSTKAPYVNDAIVSPPFAMNDAAIIEAEEIMPIIPMAAEMSPLVGDTIISPALSSPGRQDNQETAHVNGQMTDSVGHPIPNDTNSLTVGADGKVLIEDLHFVDKLSHFDRERIPERVVHAKGTGAFGTFTTYESMEKYTTADFLQRKGKMTPTLVRFSTVIGGRSSADTVRDPRGFATKFYTNEGIYDLVGNDLPVFFIRDAIKFPDVIHSLKPSPDNNLRDPQRFWDFVSLSPEATHMITWLYSDRGTIKDYRNVEGFGVNTYVWVNRDSVRHLVKFHWKTMQGIETIDRFEADMLAGSDPDIAVRRLNEAIKMGDYPKYELCVQLMTPEEGEKLPFDPLDDTKTWPEDMFPLMKVGMMTLNKNPQNFFAQIEQAAFCPANIVPGIELSADKMLQGRSFSYTDTQRHRIGPNFMQLPVNRPLTPPTNNQRDGAMVYTFNPSPINYSPNSLANNKPAPSDIPVPKPEYTSGLIGRFTIPKTDDFTQAGERYRSLSKTEQEHLCDNIAVELWRCRADIISRVMNYFEMADMDFAQGVMHDMEKYRRM